MSKIRDLVERTKRTARVSVKEYFRPVVFVWKWLTGRRGDSGQPIAVDLSPGNGTGPTSPVQPTPPSLPPTPPSVPTPRIEVPAGLPAVHRYR